MRFAELEAFAFQPCMRFANARQFLSAPDPTDKGKISDKIAAYEQRLPW
jgi:hypothetical protein